MKDAPITIASAGVAELTTRATINNDRLEGGSIGVYVYSTTGDSYKGDNIKWTYRNGFWELDDQTVVLFENNGEKQQIAAYYPYAEPTEGKVQITLPEAYGDDYDNYDYLYGEYAPLTSNPAAIKMKHLMAKVTVNVTTGTDIDAWDGIKSVELVDVPCMADWTLPGATLSNHSTMLTSPCMAMAPPTAAMFCPTRQRLLLYASQRRAVASSPPLPRWIILTQSTKPRCCPAASTILSA